MPKVLRPIGHEDRLSIVDHLDELRSAPVRLRGALVVAFGLCFWQNHVLLNLLNAPLPPATTHGANHLGGLTNDSVKAAHMRPRAQRWHAVAAALRRAGVRRRQSA